MNIKNIGAFMKKQVKRVSFEPTTIDKVVGATGMVVTGVGATCMSASAHMVVGGATITGSAVAAANTVVVGKVLVVVGSGMIVGSFVSGFVRGIKAEIAHEKNQQRILQEGK